MKILVAVDGSPFTQKMLSYLAAHGAWLGAGNHFTVLHAVPAIPPRAAAALDKGTLKDHYDEEAAKVFEPIRAFFDQHGMKAEFVSNVGHAADVIAATAEKGGYDLLVMGSHGHGSITNLVMGSVATKVLAHCGTPALLIR